MKISKRDKKLLIALLGVLVFLAAYLGVYNTYIAKSMALNEELVALTPQLQLLRDHYANLDSYETGIAEIADSVSAELAAFPEDVRSEDMIMYVTALEKSLGMTVDTVSFIPPSVISRLRVPAAGPEGLVLTPYAALHTGLSISGGLNYDQLKRLVTYIYATPERTALDSLAISYNVETGSLSYSADLSKYFVCGEDYIYKATDVPNIVQGTRNPFGVIAVQLPTPAGNAEIPD